VGGEDGGDGRVRGGGSPYLRSRRDAGRRGTGGSALGADRRSGGLAAAEVRCGGGGGYNPSEVRGGFYPKPSERRFRRTVGGPLLTQALRAEAARKVCRLVPASASGGQKPPRS
jgi:hypothetical protein